MSINSIYLPVVPEEIATRIKKHSDTSLRRLITADNYEMDEKLKENGYDPENLRKEFRELYKFHNPTLFVDILYNNEYEYEYEYDYDIDEKPRNDLEDDLKKYFGENLPKGFIADTNYETIENDDSVGEWFHKFHHSYIVIFPWQKEDKIIFIKAIAKFKHYEDENTTEITYREVKFEEMNSREAFDSIVGFGNCIHEYDWRLLVKSLIESKKE